MSQTIDLHKLSRTAGILYFLVFVAAGFAQGHVRESIFQPTSSVETAQAIASNALLFRLGFAADLIAFMADAALAVLFYMLLSPVNKTWALLSSAFRLIAHPAIGAANMLNHFAPLHLKALPSELEFVWSNFFLEMHNTGYLIAGAFFGISLLLMSPLLYKSPDFPSWLGCLMLPAGFGYLLNSFGNFLFPGHDWLNVVVVVPAVVAELSLCLFLVIKGMPNQKSFNS